MIFFGTRASNIGNFNLQNSDCSYCEMSDTQRISVFGKYAHIFWIPVFPIGKTVIAECTHCKRTIEQREFPPSLNTSYLMNMTKAKRPLWHWLGLGFVGFLFALTTLLGIIGASAEPDPRSDMLNADVNLMVKNPTMESDSISYKIKSIFDDFANEDIDPEKFKYLTKISGEKALVLVQIPKLRKVKKEGRMQALEMIELITDSQQAFEGKEMYIGVKGLITMMVIKTPTYEKNSRLALTSKLYDFYGPEPVSSE
ncbi:MAG: hypothetical protein P1U56_19735 [Saprospiraceae bacterium]|nr:hypothetical protein [Saprospiraceae bacterium]